MRWDEDVFGLECDLSTYNVVAVDDFNMGAMENKGLNIFNSAYVLADPSTATDDDYGGVLSVIGHEYFHNWTGNRSVKLIKCAYVLQCSHFAYTFLLLPFLPLYLWFVGSELHFEIGSN